MQNMARVRASQSTRMGLFTKLTSAPSASSSGGSSPASSWSLSSGSRLSRPFFFRRYQKSAEITGTS